ncbi:MAG TPA: MBL fold metallo-hydrolase [Candidatus Limnocylindria bacterium]|jgi:glyoxylase-like metal-dependent hydrolase (beta-lactamase superfamily II)
MQVYAHRVAPFDNGMYVIADGRGDAILIDPSQGEREALATIRDRGLRVIELINTHGHADHMFANAALQAATGARLAIHRADAYRLDPATAPRPRVINEFPRSVPDDLIDEGPLPYLADLELQALHTPGHTEGSTSFYLPAAGLLFSGDVLFAGNVGRVDLPGGDTAAMERSLARVAGLPPETTVYPGHGPTTTIGAELHWLQGFRFR